VSGRLAADPFDLARFVTAQEPVYEEVLSELRAGDKRTHWMWFVFPQIAGLGASRTSIHYAISGLAEARTYLAHPVLGRHRLSPSPRGQWSGSLTVDGLTISAECTPAGPVTGGPGSAGMQTIFPPASSTVTDLIRIAFAGHREQACETAPCWIFRGSHPLASAVALGSPTFQFGYHLRGGTYPHP
jgi:hypothetical protein